MTPGDAGVPSPGDGDASEGFVARPLPFPLPPPPAAFFVWLVDLGEGLDGADFAVLLVAAEAFLLFPPAVVGVGVSASLARFRGFSGVSKTSLSSPASPFCQLKKAHGGGGGVEAHQENDQVMMGLSIT